VALQTERIHIRHGKQAWIWRAMWRMAHHAAFGLDYRMFKHKGPGGFGMALYANRVLIRCGLELCSLERAVCIVAVTAFDQPFVHLVMEWLCKRWFQVCMAGIAKLWLRRFKQARFILKLVNTVATGATQVCFAMRGAFEIWMRRCMAPEACLIDLFRRSFGEAEDFVHVAAPLDVFSARSMATFAGGPFAPVHQRKA